MSLETPALRRILDALLAQRFRRARALAGWHAGARAAVDLPRLASREPELSTPEPYLAVRDALSSASDADKPALQRLAAALARELAEVAGARAHARVLQSLAGAQVAVELESLALPEALCELPACLDRPRRRLLVRGVDAALREVEGDQAERVERALEARAKLEAPAVAVAPSAEVVLGETRDAAMDLLAFRLRRARAGEPSGAARHDLEVALELLDLRAHLAPHLALPLAEQLVRNLGLEPYAEGAIAVDAERRPRRFPGLMVAPLGPRELAVVSAPLQTPADAERLAQGLGEALHRASIDDDASDIDRFLLDPALPRASGLVLALPLANPRWARRVLRLPARAAQELAQGFAIRRLFALRLAAARLGAAQELALQGPTAEVADHFRARMNAASGVEWGARGAFELDVEGAAAELRAQLFAEQLSRALVEHFDEDWWRNPHAQELFRAFWAPGGAVRLEKLAGDPVAPEHLVRAAIARAT